MNKLLIIGAGRSATVLIDYILKKADQNHWKVTVVDAVKSLAEQKTAGHPSATAAQLDINDVAKRVEMIKAHDAVVSMLPAFLHIIVAEDCLRLNKHLFTASYVSKEIEAIGIKAKEKGLIFMGELGLDPGIDHMSAMEKIDEIKEKGGELSAFRSYTGGLIAPESDDNPWHYKFTWNPRNVILAGKGTARYLENGHYKYVPYNRLFSEYMLTNIDGMGKYEVYANRDSLSYIDIYGLQGIPTIYRGTIRHLGYCDAWNALIKIGLTDDSFKIEGSENMTLQELTSAYVDEGENSLKQKISELIGHSEDSETMSKLQWLGLFDSVKINIPNASPADILENLLLDKWKLSEDDKDMIIMKHEFKYTLENKNYLLTSTLIMKGEDQVNTAMAKLVGLPLGIFTSLVMEGKITATKGQIPVEKGVYELVLKELAEYGVEFREKTIEI